MPQQASTTDTQAPTKAMKGKPHVPDQPTLELAGHGQNTSAHCQAASLTPKTPAVIPSALTSCHLTQQASVDHLPRQESTQPSHPPQQATVVRPPRQEPIQPGHPPQQATVVRPPRLEPIQPGHPPQVQPLSTGVAKHSQEESNAHKGPKKYHRKKQPPNRPGFGTLGRKITVRSNFFCVNLPHQLKIHQYDVSIGPGNKYPKWLRRLIFQSMEARYSTDVFGGQKAAFDGGKIVYCNKRLHLEGDKMSLPVDVKAEGEDRVQNFIVTIQYVTTLNTDFDRIQDILSDATERMPLVQALDVIMRHVPSMKMESDNRSFFSCPAHPYNFGQGLEVWPGYYQSVRPTMGCRFMLNLDISSTAFYTEQSVIDFMCTLLRGGKGKDATSKLTQQDRERYTRGPMSDADRKQFAKGITGVNIKVTHLPYPRKYKVVGVTRFSAQEQTFQLDTSRKMSVADYFKETYPKSPLSFSYLPCLHVGQKAKNVYIPLELCEIVKGQRCVKKLNELQTAQMIRHVTKPADE